MCGIVGYLSVPGRPSEKRSVQSIIIEGLRRLEYRGYDSAGIAFQNGRDVRLYRSVGALTRLESRLSDLTTDDQTFIAQCGLGVGHTRWATHGGVTEVNAHPHRAGPVTLVINGIIENYRELAEELSAAGVKFASQTDTELVAHLLDRQWTKHKQPLEAVRAVVKKLRGSYAAVWTVAGESALYAIKNGAPLVLGRGSENWTLASDPQGLGGVADQVAYPPEGTILRLSPAGVESVDFEGRAVTPQFEKFEWSPDAATKGPYAHFMLKEIHEQPEALMRTLSGKVDLSSEAVEPFLKKFTVEDLRAVNRIVMVACGTAHYATVVGKYFIEELTNIPVECDLASEFRYRNIRLDPQTLVIAVSQSGETADTLAAVRKVKAAGLKTLLITNVASSSMAREADEVIHTRCDAEVGVAATKTFTGQILALQLLGISLAKARDCLSHDLEASYVRELARLPQVVRETVECVKSQLDRALGFLVQEPAAQSAARTFFFIGRGGQYPLALEGALKLKEISYLHAEGYAAGELKHGPIALVNDRTVCFVLQGRGVLAEKTASNMEEVRARGSKVITVGSEPASETHLHVPEVSELLMPYVAAIPVQLIAYRMSCQLGHNPDRPRNLAKSVTVE